MLLAKKAKLPTLGGFYLVSIGFASITFASPPRAFVHRACAARDAIALRRRTAAHRTFMPFWPSFCM
jgi:hypothetical protein